MTDSPIDLLTLMPFAQTPGIELLAASPDDVRACLDWHERLCTAGGVLYGGALMALADTTGELCAYLNLLMVLRPPRSSRRPTFCAPSGRPHPTPAGETAILYVWP